ncbi:hypothetical protein QCN29_12435 [Streptomyces sp. HNM0663]|uniref:Lipoprotein n=1 Tax=Streptomyces chengmaiensis TaxID=3040919 RepID=A0ABT6HMP9_9ACTN|nr:hypothetical protein [Streptomyces chengmaiensis]MDH2389590.1 hypothetical protein [Streptomyces chengmaiensis]
MSMSAWRRAGVSLTAAVVVAGVAGCQGGGDKKAANEPVDSSRGSVTKVITAAYKKTAEAKSAKVRMTISVPAGVDGAKGGEMEMSGVLGWDPTLMDITVKGEALTAAPDAPEQMRMVWLDNAMYMDMGSEQAAKMDGKQWLKLDIAAAAEASGDEAMQKQLTAQLENMNQDPAKQLALLLDSPNLEHVGPEKIDGTDTQHYKGTLTVEEMLKSNNSLSVLGDEEREELLAKMKEQGAEEYDTQVWVNEDGYPVRMDLGVDTPQGTMKITADYSDYGAKAEVQAPPAEETFDLFQELKKLGEGMREGADASGDEPVLQG